MPRKQDYEQAARFRDQISRLKEIEAKQLVSRTDRKDLDILGFASNGAIHCVTVLFIRNGAVIGSRDHFPRLPGETDKNKLLNGFVSQYYLGRDAPSEIVLDAEIEDGRCSSRSCRRGRHIVWRYGTESR